MNSQQPPLLSPGTSGCLVVFPPFPLRILIFLLRGHHSTSLLSKQFGLACMSFSYSRKFIGQRSTFVFVSHGQRSRTTLTAARGTIIRTGIFFDKSEEPFIFMTSTNYSRDLVDSQGFVDVGGRLTCPSLFRPGTSRPIFCWSP